MAIPPSSPHIFFSVGEPSGDLHGANLIKQLHEIDSSIRCVGYGGPRMKAAGFAMHFDLSQLAVMWIARVILNIHKFLGLLKRANDYFSEYQPDAVVLIDYPGFNWWIARRAKAHGIPVFYYGTPQIWAWAGWRVKKMRRLTDHVLCKLPFEPEWFRQRNCKATYVGHPYFDELANRTLDLRRVEGLKTASKLITILPGSRDQEVAENLPMFLDSAATLHERYPETCFAIASYNDAQAEAARQILNRYPDLPALAITNATPELIELADFCLACSGSVSLELLYHAKPSIIGYRIGRFAYWAQNRFRTVKFITLANLIGSEDIYCDAGRSWEFESDAEQALMPEFLCCDDKSREIAQQLARWMANEDERNEVVMRLKNLRALYATPGASTQAAQYIASQVGIAAATADSRKSGKKKCAA